MSAGAILSPSELKGQAELAIGGVEPGSVLSTGYLATHGEVQVSTHLRALWRVNAAGRFETTIPFEMVSVALDTGALVARDRCRARDLGIFAGRSLPGELDDHLVAADPDARREAQRFVDQNTARIWSIFQQREALDPGERELVRQYRRACEITWLVRDHVYQDALHPEYARWLGAM